MNLEEAIDSICKPYPQKTLVQAAGELSERYHHKQAHTTELHRIAYVATRFPATYAVLRKIFS
jgi:ribosomal protein RSM22 (predicted rRNA methylase)